MKVKEETVSVIITNCSTDTAALALVWLRCSMNKDWEHSVLMSVGINNPWLHALSFLLLTKGIKINNYSINTSSTEMYTLLTLFEWIMTFWDFDVHIFSPETAPLIIDGKATIKCKVNSHSACLRKQRILWLRYIMNQ